MAVNVSDRFREIVYSGGAMYKCHLYIHDIPISPSLLSSIKISSPIIDKESNAFHLGSFISQQLTIKFKNVSSIDIKSGYNVALSIDLDVDGEPEQIKIGEYIIDDLAENYQKTNEIICLDNAVKMLSPINYKNAIYNYELTQDETIIPEKIYYERVSGTSWKDYIYEAVETPDIEHISEYYEPTTESISLQDLLQWICDYYDVELGSYPTINNNVQTSAYDSTISGKKYVSWIAEMFGGNAKIDRNGVLQIISLNTPPVATINVSSGKSFELGEKYKISQVTYFDAVRNFTAGNNTNNTLIIRQDNIFVTEQDNIDAIYNSVKDFEIYSLLHENRGDISLDAWDIIRFKKGDNYYNSLNNNEINYNGVIMTKINSQIPSKQQEITTNNYYKDIPDAVRKVYTEIDNINYQIRFNAEHTYTKDQVKKIAKGESLEDENVIVSYIATEKGTFDENGLSIEVIDETGAIVSDTTSLFNENGLLVRKVTNKVVDGGKPILFTGYVTSENPDYPEYAGQTLTATQNLKVENWIEIGTKSRIEEFDEEVNGRTIHKTGMFPLD